ncbi:hypothetical protein [Candidatus Stoquefichus massiliensis]|uniref:hypothetical protein n=1 Tax=Candidatus Stoquefichus massiliensis TaxID=1470350 RepID=UPI0004883061|nr:hypothetical protein [Candidatus Stoquefichus massiliensis]
MKKIMLICLSIIVTLGLMGCSSQNNEIDELKKQNKTLQEQLDNYTKNVGKINIKISGSFTLYVHDIGEDYELKEDNYKTLIVSFFQSAPFLLRVDKNMATQLKKDKSYTFEFKDDVKRNDIDYEAYLNGYISDEWFIQKCIEDVILKGEAKENETGLESNRIQKDIIDK